ncbi:swirm domain-containing protein [Stagonosporopsis vannaccii]|nr:swirm domain-containing protein [Stagonosporopsis vannaccii]
MAHPMNNSPPTNRLTVSSLLSPPEMERSNSFGSAIPSIALQYPKVDPSTSTQFHLPQLPMFKMPAYASPPISPFDPQSQKENMDNASEQGTLDPPLFRRESTSDALASDVPLFSSQPSSQEVIAQHMQSVNYAQLPSRPAEEDYKLVAQFQATVFKQALKNRTAFNTWRAQERKFEERYSKPAVQAGGIQKRPSPKKLAPAPAPRSRQPKVALPKVTPRPAREPKPKRTPKAQIFHSFDEHIGSISPKAARPATTRDDLEYNAIPDYSPPLETLIGNEKKLKAEWKGNKLDLSNDADRHLLHEAELELAATLRLSCATYLCSKRRVFQARINALKIGKEFRRTDAQQACKIDVNKASKLWQAYDKVGWFDADFFRQYV